MKFHRILIPLSACLVAAAVMTAFVETQGPTVATAPPATVYTDLGPIIAAQKSGSPPLSLKKLTLPGAAYRLTAPGILHGMVYAHGSDLVAPIIGPCFAAESPGAGVDGFYCEKSNVFFEARANGCFFQNCNLGIGADTPPGSIDQAFITAGGGTNCIVSYVACGITSTVSYYVAEDGARFVGCTGLGSIGEATFRTDTESGSTHIPTNILVQGGTWGNQKNGNGKPTFELRMGNVTLTGTSEPGHPAPIIINGDTYIGQGTPAKPPQKPGACNVVVIKDATFQNRMTGNYFIANRYGADTTISTGTTKFVDPKPTSTTVVNSGGKLTWAP